MHQHEVIVAASSLFQTIDTIVYRLLPIGSTRENPLQLRNTKLVGVRLQHRFPSCQAHHGDSLYVGMLLKCHHRMDDNRTIIHVHKLFGNVLSHSVARTAGYNKSIVHINNSFILFHTNTHHACCRGAKIQKIKQLFPFSRKTINHFVNFFFIHGLLSHPTTDGIGFTPTSALVN